MDTAMSRSMVKDEATRTATGEGSLPHIVDPRTVAPRDAREMSRQFFDRLSELEEGTHEYQYVRNTLIEMNMSLVRYAASRFRGREDYMEDIVQVGTIGLIKAIDRFELSREVEFTTFAVPYIVGEIKRFFRDTSWAVHVPRRLQEARVELARATDELQSRLGRMPTTRELSELMSLSEEEVIEARKALQRLQHLLARRGAHLGRRRGRRRRAGRLHRRGGPVAATGRGLPLAGAADRRTRRP